MPNLTCDEGGVLKEVDLFWERKIDDDAFKMKIFIKKKCLSNLKIRQAELNQGGGVTAEVDLFWKREIDSNVINLISMS